MRIWDLTIFGQEQSETLEVRLRTTCPYITGRGFIGVSEHMWRVTPSTLAATNPRSDTMRTNVDPDLAKKVGRWCAAYETVGEVEATGKPAKPRTTQWWGHLQWQAVIRAFAAQGGQPDDVAIFSEHDEIPMPSLLRALPTMQVDVLVLPTQYMCAAQFCAILRGRR